MIVSLSSNPPVAGRARDAWRRRPAATAARAGEDLLRHALHAATYAQGERARELAERLRAEPAHALVRAMLLGRFGRWGEAAPAPSEAPRSVVLGAAAFSRGMAAVVAGDLPRAMPHLTALDLQHQCTPALLVAGGRAIAPQLGIARHLLAAAVADASGHVTDAIALLRRAVVLHDRLAVAWGVALPLAPRHALASALARAGHAPEAAGVLAEDLRRHPDNPWAFVLLGDVTHALRRRRHVAEPC